MSDSVVHYNDSAGKTERSMRSYHSAWMSHWTKKSYDATGQSRIRSSNSLAKEHDDYVTKEYQSTTNIETLSSNNGIFKGTEKKVETRTSEAANESLTMTSTAIRNENMEFLGFPTDTAYRKEERSVGLKFTQETCNHGVMRPQINHNLDFEESKLSMRRTFVPSLLPMDSEENNTSSRDCHLDHDASQNENEPVKTLALFGDSGFSISRTWPVDFTASTSHVVQHGFDHVDDRTNSLPTYVDRSASTSKEQLQHTNLRFPEPEYQTRSEILVCQEKIESQSKTELPEDSCLPQDKGLFLQTSPSTKNNHSRAFDGEQVQNIQNFAGFRPSQSLSKFSELTMPEKLQHGYNSIPKFLHSVHDVGTMRICTTMDSVVGVQAGRPKFSQTTHSFLITKQTDINLNKENETFRNSRGSADGNLFSNIHNLSLLPSGHAKKGELQPIHGFKEGDFEENAESLNFKNAEEMSLHDVEALFNYKEDKGKKVEHDMVLDINLRNESSSETDIMELDEFEKKNQLSGVNFSPSNKIIRIPAAPRLVCRSERDTGYEQCSSELPDMNFEFPALPASRKMLDNGEPSTSRTESLDMETLVANAEHSESEHCLCSFAKTEPSYVWAKRLRLSASDSFIGTKSPRLRPSKKKSNLVLARNQEGRVMNSEPTLGGNHGKELMVLDKTTALTSQSEFFFAESSKSKGDSFLSHSWIQRWRHGQAKNSKNKLEPVVFCEPQSSKLEMEDIQKKQFPSIAAMALMGKAMQGIQPCKFQKKGSIVMWN